MKMLNKISNRLFSTSAAGLYMILFAIAIAVATFIENDFGTSSAQKVIFKSRWFELLMILFGISIMINISIQNAPTKKMVNFCFSCLYNNNSFGSRSYEVFRL